MYTRIGVAAMVALTCTASQGNAAENVNMLFLSTSEAFMHGPVKSENNEPSLADRVLTQLANELGASITCTKDASLLNAESLKNYRVVMFYTQGDLTKPNLDKAPPMGENGVAELLAWIEQGGGVIGFHATTDTFDTEGPELSPFLKMLGAEFAGHGKQFEGTVVVVDPEHPTMRHVPPNWAFQEEWYTFRKFNEDEIHVLALLDPGEERANQDMYNIPNHPMIWCRTLGKGRVYYTALGHREDVWTSPTFQETVRDAIRWVLGEGPAQAKPNFKKVVPTSMPEPKQEE